MQVLGLFIFIVLGISLWAMALILNLETATTNCSVSIAKDGKVVALKEHDTPNYSHSEQLHVFIREVLQEASIALVDLDAIAVSKGPGSYTGLRIGVSAAKGLCFTLDIPLIAVSTLRSIVPVLDARRMEVYSQVFDKTLLEVRETKAEIVSADSFQKFLDQGKVMLLGSGAEKCVDVLGHNNAIYKTEIVPSAKEMGSLSYLKYKEKEFQDVAYFEPYYLKDFILQGKK